MIRGSDKGPAGRPETGPQSNETDLNARRERLGSSLKSLNPDPDKNQSASRTGALTGVSQGLRLSSEFVAGVVAGALVGWIVDRFAGSSPWGLIIFLLLGFLAGILNVLRSIGAVEDKRPKLTVERDEKID